MLKVCLFSTIRDKLPEGQLGQLGQLEQLEQLEQLGQLGQLKAIAHQGRN
ncbi:MAG: hypothetical protein AAGE96_11370 [Cyanobacteria bacterium P01_G01_bin.19]